jgi:Family of unknown function (DUF5996)/Glycine-rich domain-containing protein-like
MRRNPVTLPELHLPGWRPTEETLHSYCQIVGKVRLATTSPRNHWWNAPLYVDVRGVTTRCLRHNGTTFQIDFDFVDHTLLVWTHDGRSRSFELAEGVAATDFEAHLHQVLGELGIDVAIKEHPFGVRMSTPFPHDHKYASWDRDAVERYGRVLDWSDSVLEEFSGWFCGKSSDVHLVWHSFDLALSLTRFSGRPAPPITADTVTLEAYSEEVISFGFWAGADNVPDAAYYSYTSPEPDGLRDQRLPAGDWIASGNGSIAILPYETVRTARDPRGSLLTFLQGAYEAGSRLAGWDTSALESRCCPNPGQLRECQTTAAHGHDG